MTVPGDPAPLVKASLVAFLNGEARVVRDVPDTYLPKSGPIVLVADDGGPLEWPVLSRNTIRVTVLGDGMTLVRNLAGRCLGHVFDDMPSGLSYIRRNGTTLLEGRDPRTGADFCSFTITATVRTTAS